LCELEQLVADVPELGSARRRARRALPAEFLQCWNIRLDGCPIVREDRHSNLIDDLGHSLQLQPCTRVPAEQLGGGNRRAKVISVDKLEVPSAQLAARSECSLQPRVHRRDFVVQLPRLPEGARVKARLHTAADDGARKRSLGRWFGWPQAAE
jgi:hypothetical protein